jgi:hypothetical protein
MTDKVLLFLLFINTFMLSWMLILRYLCKPNPEFSMIGEAIFFPARIAYIFIVIVRRLFAKILMHKGYNPYPEFVSECVCCGHLTVATPHPDKDLFVCDCKRCHAEFTVNHDKIMRLSIND